MLEPFVHYTTFTTGMINELRGDVRLTVVNVPYHSKELVNGEYYDTVCNEQMLKVVAYPSERGTAIGFMRHTQNDEGPDASYEGITQDADENGDPFWRIECGSYGRDCDGGYSHFWEGTSDGKPDPNYNNTAFPTLGDQSIAKERRTLHRDYSAEAAGY